MKASDVFVSVCAVASNDRSDVESFVARTSQVLTAHFPFHEMIIVDNHSLDDTPEQVQKLQKTVPNLRLIRLSRQYSIDTALSAGLENSIGDYTIVMDLHADPPELIPQLVEKAQTGFEIVIVKRRDTQKYHSPVDRMLAGVLYGVVQKLLRIEIAIDDTHFRLFSRQVVNSLSRIRHKRRYLKYFNTMVGFKQTSLEYDSTATNLPVPTFRRSERVITALNMIVSTSVVPLRLASIIGLLASGINLLYFGYILAITLIKRDIVEGWITTSVMSTTMFFILFVILTILTEYIAQLLEEIKDHPLYFIEYETASSTNSYSQIMADERLNVV